jgi:ribonuclease-3 family protein
VIELAVRELLVKSMALPPELLHSRAMDFVTATKQSAAVENMLPVLNEAETEIYKRGRNAKAKVPKSASAIDYRRATGMECLFGYLYLTGENDRIKELFKAAFGGALT